MYLSLCFPGCRRKLLVLTTYSRQTIFEMSILCMKGLKLYFSWAWFSMVIYVWLKCDLFQNYKFLIPSVAITNEERKNMKFLYTHPF